VIFSTGTYAYLAELVFVFLVTDLLRYKPVIILDGISAIITWSLLIWGKSIQLMQVMIVIGFHGFFQLQFVTCSVSIATDNAKLIRLH
jgi:thiamine transporter 2/3